MKVTMMKLVKMRECGFAKQACLAFRSLCLKCTLLGHPKPTVTWEKNGELVDEERTDGHIQTRNEGNDYLLEIDECRVDDAGKYTVTARNSLGKQTASVEVTVTGHCICSYAITDKLLVDSARNRIT